MADYTVRDYPLHHEKVAYGDTVTIAGVKHNINKGFLSVVTEPDAPRRLNSHIFKVLKFRSEEIRSFATNCYGYVPSSDGDFPEWKRQFDAASIINALFEKSISAGLDKLRSKVVIIKGKSNTTFKIGRRSIIVEGFPLYTINRKNDDIRENT